MQVVLFHVQEAVVLHVGGAEGQDIDGGETRLLTRRHEHDDRLGRRVDDDRVVNRLRHGDDSRRVVSDVETLEQKYYKTF